MDRSPTVDELWEAWGGPLFGFVVSLVGVPSEAEDVLQEVFLALVRAMRGGLELREPRAYLYRAARNEAHRHLRRQRRGPLLGGDERIMLVEAPPERRDEAIDLSRALAALPVEQREVVVLKLQHGMTFQEIGDCLDLSPNTAASRHRYALAKLRDLLRGEEDERGT